MQVYCSNNLNVSSGKAIMPTSTKAVDHDSFIQPNTKELNDLVKKLDDKADGEGV